MPTPAQIVRSKMINGRVKQCSANTLAIIPEYGSTIIAVHSRIACGGTLGQKSEIRKQRFSRLPARCCGASICGLLLYRKEPGTPRHPEDDRIRSAIQLYRHGTVAGCDTSATRDRVIEGVDASWRIETSLVLNRHR